MLQASTLDSLSFDTSPFGKDTLYDALIRYDLGATNDRLSGLEVAVNATNLFDNHYLTGCYVNYNWCWYGNRRTVQGTISYKF